MKILANDNNKFRYPTWNVFTKLWKSTILPVIKQTVDIDRIDKFTTDENYLVATTEPVDGELINRVLDNIQVALENNNFDVIRYNDPNSECDISIEGKDRNSYAPGICINVYPEELDNDDILQWDDARWNSNDIMDDSFKPSYQAWLDNLGLVDNNYDGILKAPRDIQEAYCDWFRAHEAPNEFYVSIIPVNM